MTEGRGVAGVVDGRLDERLVERTLEALSEAPPEDRVREAVETVVDAAGSIPLGRERRSGPCGPIATRSNAWRPRSA